MQNKELITINLVSQILGVSLDTLRRWDKSGKLRSIRRQKGGHRYYETRQLAELMPDLNIFKMVLNWASGKTALEPPSDFYCPDSSIFQARLSRLESEIIRLDTLKDKFSALTSITGEIGNNAYDHNLGNWPDIPGVFFIYSMEKRLVAIADRGQGILTTLRKIKPELKNDEEALKVAFTEIISGRAPESRGNGLKFVRKLVASSDNFDLLFISGQAELRIGRPVDELLISKTKKAILGCLALIKF